MRKHLSEGSENWIITNFVFGQRWGKLIVKKLFFFSFYQANQYYIKDCSDCFCNCKRIMKHAKRVYSKLLQFRCQKPWRWHKEIFFFLIAVKNESDNFMLMSRRLCFDLEQEKIMLKISCWLSFSALLLLSIFLWLHCFTCSLYAYVFFVYLISVSAAKQNVSIEKSLKEFFLRYFRQN